jgi:cyclic 2,3-diphosphoglycerate synthase
VIASAIEDLRASGTDVTGALLLGGVEKLPDGGLDEIGGVKVLPGVSSRRTNQNETAPAALARAIDSLDAELVWDLSDEPVLDYRRRHELVSVALYKGIAYEGAGFRFEPPPRHRLADKPSIAIIGSGKRTGKTAVAGYVARAYKDQGRKPVVVAMGRGGPAEPEVLHGDEIELTAKELIELADSGKHAASDYIEDAALARVPTVGCRRCGGGLSGAVEFSNVAEGVELANGIEHDLLLLEGSGAAIPPVHADATILVIPAGISQEYLAGYLGPYRLLLADLVVATMCEEPFGSASTISSVVSHTQARLAEVREGDKRGEAKLVCTVFRPHPTRSVDGAKAIVATTAPEAAGPKIERHLRSMGCEVRGITHSLSDRKKLRAELKDMPEADVLLCEIKAASVDVAARWGIEKGMDVVFMDNVPEPVDSDDLDEALAELLEIADQR